MRYDDLHPCVRNALRRNDIRDFMFTDAQTKYLVTGVLHPLAMEMEKVLVEDNAFSIRQAWAVIERVLMKTLPTREKLAEQQRAHERLVRQLEQGISNPRGQEATTDVQTD